MKMGIQSSCEAHLPWWFLPHSGSVAFGNGNDDDDEDESDQCLPLCAHTPRAPLGVHLPDESEATGAVGASRVNPNLKYSVVRFQLISVSLPPRATKEGPGEPPVRTGRRAGFISIAASRSGHSMPSCSIPLLPQSLPIASNRIASQRICDCDFRGKLRCDFYAIAIFFLRRDCDCDFSLAMCDAIAIFYNFFAIFFKLFMAFLVTNELSFYTLQIKPNYT